MRYLAILIFATVVAIHGCANSRISSGRENPKTEALIAADMARRAKYALPMPMERFFKGDVSVYGPITIADAEERSLARLKLAPSAPQIPFGYQHEKWTEFVAKIQATDQLVEFQTHSQEGSIAGGYAGHGYAVIRNGMVIDVFAGSVY